MCLAPEQLDSPDPDTGIVEPSSDSGVTPIPWPDEGVVNNRPMCAEVTDCGDSEPNDNARDAIFLTEMPERCTSFGLEDWGVSHEDSLCAGDVDQFIIEYTACRQGAFKITTTLTTRESCTMGGNLQIADGPYNCQDRNVRCEIIDNVERITMIIYEQPESRPVEQVRFAVSTGLAASGLDYILTATIGR